MENSKIKVGQIWKPKQRINTFSNSEAPSIFIREHSKTYVFSKSTDWAVTFIKSGYSKFAYGTAIVSDNEILWHYKLDILETFRYKMLQQ